MPRSRLSTALYVVLVFVSGILVGAVGTRLYTTTTASANTAPKTPEEWKKRYLDQFKKRVGADDTQLAKASSILDDTRHRMDALRADEKKVHDRLYQEQVESMRAILTGPQQKAYDDWRAERQREREKAQKKN